MRLSKIVFFGITLLYFVFVVPSAMALDPKEPTADQKNNCCQAYTKADSLQETSNDLAPGDFWLMYESYDRTGKVADCPKDQDKDAGHCYKKCPDGYKGEGKVCWQICPAGYKDDGKLCKRDADIYKKKSYDRGAGYPLWNKKACLKEQHMPCERCGQLYYAECKDGYESAYVTSCTTCLEKGCPSADYHDKGATCKREAQVITKKSQTRGSGVAPKECKDGREFASGMCYVPARHCYSCKGSHCTKILHCDICTIAGAHVGDTKMPYLGKYSYICATSQAWADICEDKQDHSIGLLPYCQGDAKYFKQ